MRALIKFLYHLGGVGELLWGSFLALGELHRSAGKIFSQIYHIGVGSLPLVAITSCFTGMVAAVQTAYQIKDFVPMIYLGVGVAKAVLIELGPVLTALVVAGRVGAGMAAELGTMRVTEQIDALELMGVDPHSYLVLPRLVAGVVAVPALTVFAEAVAIAGAAVVAKLALHTPPETFLRGARMFFVAKDLWGGLVKAGVFGFIVSLMGSYFGFNAGGGAVGVGRATTQAVVASSLLILASDYVLGTLIYGG